MVGLVEAQQSTVHSHHTSTGEKSHGSPNPSRVLINKPSGMNLI